MRIWREKKRGENFAPALFLIFFKKMVKGAQKMSNHLEAEKVLDMMADWAFSLNNLLQDQGPMNQRIF